MHDAPDRAEQADNPAKGQGEVGKAIMPWPVNSPSTGKRKASRIKKKDAMRRAGGRAKVKWIFRVATMSTSSSCMTRVSSRN